MKITKAQLKQIIKEELGAVMNESEFDYLSHLEHLAARYPELNHMFLDDLGMRPVDRRYNWDLVQQTLKMLGPVASDRLEVALEVDEGDTVSKLRDVGRDRRRDVDGSPVYTPEDFARDIEAKYEEVAGQGHGVKIG